MGKPLVILPDTEVDGVTKEEKGCPKLKFVYRPLTGKEFMLYTSRLERAGKQFEKLGEVNYRLLANHVISVEWPENTSEIDVKKPEDWMKVTAEVLFGIASVIIGAEDNTEDETLSDL